MIILIARNCIYHTVVTRLSDVRSRCDVQKANSTDTIKSVLQRCKCGGLRKEHEKPIKALVEVRVFFGF